MLHVPFDIMNPDDNLSSLTSKEICKMKKLMTLMLGMTFVFATVAPSFAQDTKKEETTKEKKAPKKSKKKADTTKKEGGR
jgi:hypothetical protein